jgi:hypothetical protein
MLRDNFDHGFAEEAWQAAKEEAKKAMITRARTRGMITYSDLVSAIRSLSLQPHDARLDHLLGEIAADEDKAGRGMLTVIVVHKTGDMEPGPGFYEMAKALGRDTSDPVKCWVSELHRVHGIWSASRPPSAQ